MVFRDENQHIFYHHQHQIINSHPTHFYWAKRNHFFFISFCKKSIFISKVLKSLRAFLIVKSMMAKISDSSSMAILVSTKLKGSIDLSKKQEKINTILSYPLRHDYSISIREAGNFTVISWAVPSRYIKGWKINVYGVFCRRFHLLLDILSCVFIQITIYT